MPHYLSTPDRLQELAEDCAAIRTRLGLHPPASAATQVAEALWFQNVVDRARDPKVPPLAASLLDFYELVARRWVRGSWIVSPPPPRTPRPREYRL